MTTIIAEGDGKKRKVVTVSADKVETTVQKLYDQGYSRVEVINV